MTERGEDLKGIALLRAVLGTTALKRRARDFTARACARATNFTLISAKARVTTG